MTKISDLDLFFLSFDEPNAEQNWADLLQKAPWARRVHGVKGFDNAHKACADRSNTEHFITIDGDNIVDERFFDLDIDVSDRRRSVSWNGRNAINGLVYGNGGPKCWTRKMVFTMKTHENADSERAQVDFCWEDQYKHIGGVWSTTYCNASPLQAFRTGLREGVKMCLDRGRRCTPKEFLRTVAQQNLNCLLVWMSIGIDVDNGDWAMFGARLGAYHALLEPEWDHLMIRDYDAIEKLWRDLDGEREWFVGNKPDVAWMGDKLHYFGDKLRNLVGLPVVDLDVENSRFFKTASVPLLEGKNVNVGFDFLSRF